MPIFLMATVQPPVIKEYNSIKTKAPSYALATDADWGSCISIFIDRFSLSPEGE
jgi:hypothetical protein